MKNLSANHRRQTQTEFRNSHNEKIKTNKLTSARKFVRYPHKPLTFKVISGE